MTSNNDFTPTICTACAIHHIENCPKCAGFGMYKNYNTFITAGEAISGNLLSEWVPCNYCGGTPAGVTHAKKEKPE